MWRLGVTDLGHDLVNARLIKLIVELRHCLVAGLLPEAHVPAIGQRVVVEAALLLVDIDADIVDEAVGRAACVWRTDPRRVLLQEGVQLRQRHAPVTIEVHKLDVVEHPVAAEDVHVEMTRDRILTPVVGLARFEDEGVQLADIEILTLEDLFSEPRLEELTARESGDDVADPLLVSEVGGQRVNGLETAIADVGEALEAVDEDLLHVGRTPDDELDAQRLHDTADVGLGRFRDEAIIQGEDQRLQSQAAELIQHVRTVFTAAQQHQAVVLARAGSLHLRDDGLEFIRCFEIRLRLLDVRVIPAADVAHPLGVIACPGYVGSETAPRAVTQLFRRSHRERIDDIHHTLANVGVLQEPGLDLAQLNARAGDFHLMIGAAQEFQAAIGAPASDVSSLVQAQRLGPED